jgi:hypothetical protein
MATSSYKRVSRKRVCRVCGKPDWCSFTADEKISFCARVIENADRVSRTGWGVFYHEKSLFSDEPVRFPRHSLPKKTELAPLEIRDFVYRKLIELAPATDSKEIIDGSKGLRARKILDFENYGALPQTQSERRDLAREIRSLINQKFPEFVRRQKSSLSGLPGFWLDKTGRAQVWLEKDYSCPMMLIPYRTQDGLVQACQIRYMCRKLSNDSVRYVWLSTPKKSGDLSCGSPLHFAAYNTFSSDKPTLVTEGALKAETAQIFNKDFNVLASAGVACSHEEIATRVSRIPLVLIAFDTDYYENHHVARAMAKLLNLILASNKADFYNRIKILTWNRKYKGIDDALLKGKPINSQSLFEWYESLAEKCQKEVERFLQKGFFTVV